MERTGKSILTFLILIMLGLQPAWASTPTALTDSVKQKASKPVPAKGYHIVEKGDTYYGLSRRYHLPIDSLKHWNGESLKLGSTLRVSFIAGKKAAATKPRTAAPPAPVAKSGSGTKSVLLPTAPAGVKTATPVLKAPKGGSNTRIYTEPAPFAPAKKVAQRVLVIPFDPYLYFSDADNDIARQSRIPKQNVRYIFRSRLNAFMDPKGFESINLLGNAFQEHKNEVDRIYKSVSYSYQPIVYSKYHSVSMTEKTGNGAVAWLQKQKDKFTAAPSPEAAGNTSVAKDPGKYYGVNVKDPALYSYFNQKYAVDYYLFLNQFEIHSDFTSCLDRTQDDFTREFLVHYTLYDNQGTLISGNKISVSYISHVNDIEQIVCDNLTKMAQHMLADLPQPAALTNQTNTRE